MRHCHLRHLPFSLMALALTGAAVAAMEPASPSFRRDVMPVFFRAGCNAGTCHGSARGKDGFMLSLFGYDPAGDYRRTVEELPGRRVNTAAPAESLLLLKATGAVPHTGGRLFDKESALYKTLADWIAAGAPDDVGGVPEVTGIALSTEALTFEQAGAAEGLRLTASYADGTSRDVTDLGKFFSNNPAVADIDQDGRVTAKGPGDTNVFGRFSRFTVGAEVIVLPPAAGFEWPNPPADTFIDRLVFERLEKLRIAPSDVCDDETFLRRVTLDLVARPPTVEEYAAFMADSSPDKRSKKIDALLASDAFADYQAALWGEQLRIIGGNYAPQATVIKAAHAFATWIRDEFRAGRPLDEFVAEMVAASGPNLSHGPANLYTMLVHKPRPEPKMLAADFSQVFLGVQIQCAECHNHPFDRWTMNDYYGFVSFFTGVQWKPGIEPREKRIYWNTKANRVPHPVDGRVRPAKTLGAVEPVAAEGDPRPALAAWLTAPDNEIFSRNLANRIWAQFFGRGVVEPVDDMRVSNPPVNAPLMDALSQRLVELKFDLRSFVRDICNSRVYQLSVTPTPSNVGDTRQFSHAHLRRLRADVLLDSIVAVTGVPRQLPGWPAGTKAIEFYPRSGGDTGGPQLGDVFFGTFGRSSRGTICACETKSNPTLAQAMHLVVGDTVRDRLAAGDGVVRRLVETKATPEEIVTALFIRTLSRKPTAEELAGFVEMAAGSPSRLLNNSLPHVIDDVPGVKRPRKPEVFLPGKSPGGLVPRPAGDQAAYEDMFWSLLNSTEFLFNH
jgi:hypothetical protein